MSRTSAVSPDQFGNFGDLLKFLRRRAGFTQRELSIAVGYSDTQISRLEQNQRIPDQATLAALFVPALFIEQEPKWAARLLELATEAQQKAELPAQPVPTPEPSLLDRIVHGQLVGRQAELKQLHSLWTRAQQGYAHLALISGEPGIGKTRLAREVLEYARSNRAVVLTGGCYEFEAVVPYLPFIEALREWVEAQSQETLRGVLGAAAPEVAKLVPEIEARLGPLTPNPSLSPNEERLRLFDNLARFFQALATPHGLLLFLDDVHWADQGTLALLHYLLRRLRRDERILILAAYREVELDRAHPLSGLLVEWNRERLVTRVPLGRLSVEETGAMLAALFGETSASLEFSEAIHRETEGNPFFVEEVVKSLIEQGEIYRVEAGWDCKAIAELTIPQSIKEAIGRRLNRLSAGCMDVLHTAAALGKVLPFDELAAVASVNEDQLLDALDEASAAQLICAEGGEAFAFTHDKIREVLYEELNPIRRRRLHQRIGEGLEKLYTAPAAHDAHVPDLAHHFIQSGDLQKRLTYSLEAAIQARRLFALEEAVGYYQHARESAEALDLPDQLASIHENVGDIHSQRGVFRPAIEHYQQALTLIAPEETARRAALNMKIGASYAQIADQRALGFLRLAERELDPATQANELAITLAFLGRFHHYQSQAHQAIEYYERARELAEPLNRADALYYIYGYLAGACAILTQFDKSREWAHKEVTLGERSNNLLTMAAGYEYLAEIAFQQGRWVEALEYAARDRELGEKVDALNHIGWSDMCRTFALYGRGDLQPALETNRAALTLAEQIGERRLALWLGTLLALIEADLGFDEAAHADAMQWLKRADELGELLHQCLGRHGLAYYHVQRSEWAQAMTLYDHCAALYSPTDNRLAQLLLGPNPALVRLESGRVDEAAQLITDHLTLAREAAAHHYVGCALRVQGQIFAAQGLTAEARAAFDESVATLDQCGSRLEWGRALFQRGLFRQTLDGADVAQNDWQRALTIFEACGAARDRERAAKLLR